MNNIPIIIYVVWAIFGPFLLIYFTNNQRESRFPAFFVVIYLFITVVGVFIFYELLDLRKGESLNAFRLRKQDEKKNVEEQEKQRMKLLSQAQVPSLCCKCGNKIGNESEWEIPLEGKSPGLPLEKILIRLKLISNKSDIEKSILSVKICKKCLSTLSLAEKILDFSQPVILLITVLISAIYGYINLLFLFSVVWGIIIGLLISGALEIIIGQIVNMEFYKIDWKFRFITFSNKKYEGEFNKINPGFTTDK